MRKSLLPLLAMFVVGAVTAGEPGIATSQSAEAKARAALQALIPSARIDEVRAAPIAGFQEALVDGQVFYVSDDGRYLFQGALYDVKARSNLSESRLNTARSKALSSIPAAGRIVFAPAQPKYTVSVFTDYDCGYCRKLHAQIAEYNRQGIAVEYLAWPRSGLQGSDYKVMESIWCAPDRKAALTDAKAGQPVSVRHCDSPVAAQYRLGQQLGVKGTPAVFSARGEYLSGYKSPAELRALLDQKAAAAR